MGRNRLVVVLHIDGAKQHLLILEFPADIQMIQNSRHVMLNGSPLRFLRHGVKVQKECRVPLAEHNAEGAAGRLPPGIDRRFKALDLFPQHWLQELRRLLPDGNVIAFTPVYRNNDHKITDIHSAISFPVMSMPESLSASGH